MFTPPGNPADRGRRSRRTLLAVVATLALAAGAALIPSVAYAIDQGNVHLTGTVEGVGEIGLSNGRYTPSDSQSAVGAPTVAAGASTDWWISAPAPTMTFEYRIVERGAPTKYWIVGEANVNSSDWASASCSVWHETMIDRRMVDQEDGSPYVCAAFAPGLAWPSSPHATFKVHSQTWATVRGVIEPTSSELDRIALTGGIFNSENSDLVVNGATHTAASPPDEIVSGGTTQVAAYLRNAESSSFIHKAHFYFAYQIVEDGFPTGYWVTGHAENVRAGTFQHTSACHISLGRSGAGGGATAFSPYTCDMVGENRSGRGDWQVTFKVGAHDYTAVEGREAQDLVKNACTAADAKCAFVMTDKHSYSTDLQLIGTVNNGSNETENVGVTYVEGRTEKNSIDASVALEAETSRFWIESFRASFKLAYGHEWVHDSAMTWRFSKWLAAHTTAYFSLSPAYERITGDYFVLYKGRYYRALDATFDLPFQTAGPGVVTTTTAAYYGVGDESAVQESDTEVSAPTAPVTPAV